MPDARALRVVHVIGGLSLGGAERQLVNMLNAMRADYRAAVFIGPPPSGPHFHDDLDDEVAQYFVRVRRRSMPLGMLRLVMLLRKLRPHVVHTHMFHSNLYGSIAARLANVPVIFTSEHGENPWKKDHHRWLERRVISPNVYLRYCVSSRILSIRRDADGIPATKLELAANGTPLPELTEKTPNELPVVGSVGRFVAAKDYPTLIRAAAELKKRGVQFKLVVIGDGPEKQAATDLVRELELEDTIQLVGAVSNVGDWYRTFDLFVSSSVREGQPVTLLEAMSYAIPVVATDVGASAETLGNGGIIVESGEPPLLASAIQRILGDDAKRRRLGLRARERVEDVYSVDVVAARQLEEYAKALDQKNIGRI